MIDFFYFKYLQLKMKLVIFLGGGVTREIIKPLYRPLREFGELEYDELSRVYEDSPILQDIVHVMLNRLETILTDLQPTEQNDRYRIKIIAKMEALREVLEIPETARRFLKELGKEARPEELIFNNLGVKNDKQNEVT